MDGARLFYLIGASGCGKDSLLAELRRALPADAPLAIAHRYITRPADAGGENHVALGMAEFQRRLVHGCFAMHWHSHGLHYGIGREIDYWLASGLDVMVNGSRGYLDTAAADYPQLFPVLVQVAPAVLRERLRARGRETPADVEQRLAQAERFDRQLDGQPLRRIDNNGTLAAATRQLLDIVLEPRP